MVRIQKLIDEQWGRKRIILKADGEHAIKELRDKIRQLGTAETLTEAPARGDSKSNGRAEMQFKNSKG